MARTMQQFVDHFESTPVVVLPCLIRYRAPYPSEGASVYPACQNLLLAARALGYGGVMTVWHLAVEDELRAAPRDPRRRGHRGHDPAGPPRWSPRPRPSPPARPLRLRRSLGRRRRRGPRILTAPGSPAPARPASSTDHLFRGRRGPCGPSARWRRPSRQGTARRWRRGPPRASSAPIHRGHGAQRLRSPASRARIDAMRARSRSGCSIALLMRCSIART